MSYNKFNARQKAIRELEWNAMQDEIKNRKGRFLDVGAGSGYALYKAEQLGFDVHGIDPIVDPHGAFEDHLRKYLERIKTGTAEAIPFPDNYFSVVYSSHSLEHFDDQEKGLAEMSRVTDKEGIVIISVPTGLMCFINLMSQYLFTTHKRIAKFLLRKRDWKHFRNIIVPNAHGSQNKTLIGDMMDFRIKVWKKLISKQFNIDRVILPCLYPFPDFPQLFPYIKSNKVSSSVIFICSQKKK